jgi:hypothetical protein
MGPGWPNAKLTTDANAARTSTEAGRQRSGACCFGARGIFVARGRHRGVAARFIFLGFAILPTFAGCAWRTSRSEYVIGPTLYRFAASANQRPIAIETLTVPVLFEGGRQWGFSIGGVQRLAMTPRNSEQPHDDYKPRGVLLRPEPGRWNFSWFYLQAPLRQPPIFIRRSVVGAQAGLGVEQRTFSLGYSTVTATTPREEAIYQLEFDSRRPLDATFVTIPVNDFSQPKPIPTASKDLP